MKSQRHHNEDINMTTNEQFQLSTEQHQALTDWMQPKIKAAVNADAAESLSLKVTFTFWALGREIVATCGKDELTLESAM